MPLEPGLRLGVYEVRSALGTGGMGEVYRARDTRLQRDVALKILPEAFASDAERLARFEREAQVLASLNHPHIAQIYGFEVGESTNQDRTSGVRALVLELVEGETLADRITATPLPLDDVVSIARQIADALESAHEQGIVHRDLKPSNIKVRPDGTVKVLDFGLAKLAQASGPAPQASGSALTVSPTITTPAMTQVGVIMGTAAYMSPEQAKGREADKRSDVWAFGAVLYEMLTGKRAFDSEDTSDTLAAVLKTDPDWTRLPADVPPVLRTLVQRCLTKDRRQRVSDISAARFVLTELGHIGFSAMPNPPLMSDAGAARSRRRSMLLVAATALLTAIVVSAVAYVLRPAPQPPIVARFAVTPGGQNLTGTPMQVVSISPDGTRLAYSANQRIYVRSIDDLEPRAVTEQGSTLTLNPVFAPDGESLLYATISEGGPSLRRIPFGGGAASTIATLADVPSLSGISWGRDGILIGVPGGRGGILRVAEGGATERIVSAASGEMIHGPQMLPGGRTVLFTAARTESDDRWDKAQIVAQSLVDGKRRVLVEGGSDGRYVASGHLLYSVGGTIYAAPFDADKLVIGRGAPVIAGVRRATGAQTGATQLAISETGTLAYIPGPATAFSTARDLVVGDGRNEPVLLKVPTGVYVHPRVSPNGRVLAVGRNDEQSSDIWTYDLAGTIAIQRLTLGGANRFPVWSADSRHVTFQSTREGDAAIWWQDINGGTAERLTRATKDEAHVPEAWSRDGTRLLFSVRKGSVFSLWVYTLPGRKAEPFGNVESAELLSATFSPDGRWVAYATTPRAGGTISPNRGVFVEPFPPTGLKRQVPKTLLDYHPVWAPDGRSIFYVAGSGRPTVSVAVTTQPALAFGTPVELPRAPVPGFISVDARGYDVLPDGRVVSVAGLGAPTGAAVDIRVVINWFEELKRLVPAR